MICPHAGKLTGVIHELVVLAGTHANGCVAIDPLARAFSGDGGGDALAVDQQRAVG